MGVVKEDYKVRANKSLFLGNLENILLSLATSSQLALLISQ